MLAHRNRLIFAQLVFPFAAEPARPVSLGAAWLVILELLRRVTVRLSFYDGDLAYAASLQAGKDYPLARKGNRAAMVRLRVMWAIVPPPAVRPLPLP
jgi:hypothetical protein